MVMMLMAETLGSRLKRAREAADMTQGQLALRAKVKQSWLSAVENDAIDEPGAQRLLRVARIIGADLTYLVTGSSSDDPEVSAVFNRVRHLYPKDHVMRLEQLLSAIWLKPDPADHQPGDKHQQLRQDHGPHTQTD